MRIASAWWPIHSSMIRWSAPRTASDRRVEHAAGSQREQHDDAGDGEAAARLLVAVLRVFGLVLGGVGHAGPRAVSDHGAPAVGQLALGRMGLEAVG